MLITPAYAKKKSFVAKFARVDLDKVLDNINTQINMAALEERFYINYRINNKIRGIIIDLLQDVGYVCSCEEDNFIKIDWSYDTEYNIDTNINITNDIVTEGGVVATIT